MIMESNKFAGALGDGEPIYATDGILYFSCCDCGLTHMLIATVIGKTDVEMRFFRDGQRSYHRRKNKKYLFTKRDRK